MTPTPHDPPPRRSVRPRDLSRELRPEQSPALLQELHLLTRRGQLNADALRKLKQVNHLIRLLEPALDDVYARHPEPRLLDVGSGNSYLGFLLHEVVIGPAGRGEIVSLEAREEMTHRSRERARKLGHTRMRFATGAIESWTPPERLHLVTALHACDTATDDALVLALRHGVDHVAVVPCCQAEVAAQLAAMAKPPGPAGPAAPMSLLHAHAWHRREFGSHLTNVIRALTLEAFGYQVTVTELVGWEHSFKNELILGRRVHAESRRARQELESLLEATGVAPKLTRALGIRAGIGAETTRSPD